MYRYSHYKTFQMQDIKFETIFNLSANRNNFKNTIAYTFINIFIKIFMNTFRMKLYNSVTSLLVTQACLSRVFSPAYSLHIVC